MSVLPGVSPKPRECFELKREDIDHLKVKFDMKNVKLKEDVKNLKKPEPFAYKNWTDLIKPTKIDVDKEEQNFLGSVTIEPLERGFGLTIGNALRRILLSSLQGAAVTSIQIDGILHEFSSIPGMIEDVTEFILNIKSLAVKLNSDQPKKMTLKVNGPGEVKASQIETGSEIEIINSDLILCHLEKSAKINLEFNSPSFSVMSEVPILITILLYFI